MHIAEIFFKDFRNFSELNLTTENAINIFLGRNAQGKTNILEAIYFSSIGRSRAAKDSELIRWEKDCAIIRINFFRADVSHSIAIEFSTDKKRRKILLDGGAIQFRGLIGKLNSVMFSPEDLFMFKNSPSVRRKFLDGEISQASPVYFADLAKYNRLVDQRNNLLKKIREGLASPANLDLWSEQLAIYAAKITLKRLQSVDKLNFLANLMQRKISAQSENLSIIYDVHGPENSDREKLKSIGLNLDAKKFNKNLNEKNLADFYRETLQARKFSDIKRGSTSLGPHLDDLKFFINGRELKIFGSQGQMRTAALALKLSELQFLKSETGEYPILLLDDVMSELDAARREQLLNFLRREKIQTFITATEKEYFPRQKFGKYFFVTNGKVEVEKNERA